MVDKFLQLDLWTPNVGLAFGILAFSSTLSQLICVPELLLCSKDSAGFEGIPSRDHFKLPLFIANLLACILKCVFAIVGAMMFTDETNIFGDLLFSKTAPDAVAVSLTVFAAIVVLPQSIDL